MNLIVLLFFSIFQLVVSESTSNELTSSESIRSESNSNESTSNESTSSLYNDVELTTDTIKLTSISSILIPKLTTNLSIMKSEVSSTEKGLLINESPDVQSAPTTSKPEELSANRTEELIEPSTSKTGEKEPNLIQPESLSSEKKQTMENEINTNEMLSKPLNAYKITTVEIRKSNQTFLSTIMLRVHSILQYSSNFSRRAVIPYVYIAKIQADGLYRQIAESTFLQNYASNVVQTLVNDVVNQECNAFTTMINYVLMPAIDAHGSNYLTARTRELSDGVSRWHGALQRWSASLSSFFSQIADLRFEECGQSLLCSLGKAKYESVREEPRMNRAKVIQFVNNLFNMPMLEKRMKTHYLLARQLGAAGGDCASLNANCIINFDTIFEAVKQLF